MFLEWLEEEEEAVVSGDHTCRHITEEAGAGGLTPRIIPTPELLLR